MKNAPLEMSNEEFRVLFVNASEILSRVQNPETRPEHRTVKLGEGWHTVLVRQHCEWEKIERIQQRLKKISGGDVDCLREAVDEFDLQKSVKARYILHPSPLHLANWMMLTLAIAGACAAWWLAVFGH